MPNALAAESSPYLQQHADNPVDWLPWGDEALSLAAERDLPVLLSIGYSSCHWCHVMAHESFEDPEVAAYMNEHFVNIKVDREERPDIDAVYMEVAQAISGHGGWPLTVFLTPQQVPFYAGTYFPPEPRPELPSFMQLLESLVAAWTTQRDQIDQRSSALIESLQSVAGLPAAAEALDAATLTLATEGLHRAYDEQFGGFGGAPKFPSHSVLEFLLGRPDPADREPALESLRKMAAGGIHDQIGGGFARYSVDRRWHIPHFEKMLYDNALLARAYLHASQVATDDTDAAEFRRVCRGILDWMLREMTDGDDGFASALDADSIDATGHLEEGAFYAWEIDELREVVEAVAPGHVGDIFLYWGVIDHGEFEGKNVLFVNAPERKPDDPVLEEVRRALYQRRETRHRPGRDEKRLTSWNALALAALAEAGAVLDEPKYSLAAVACADFIERELALDGGRLRRSWTEGAPGAAGFLEDHAYVVAGYLTLYEHGGDERWFARAREIADATLEHFEDREGGGFFTVADDQPQLIVRRKDIEDNPIPSGNSAIALALLRLSALTGEARFSDAATRSLEGVQRIAGRLPVGFGHALQAIDFRIGPVREIALVGADAERRELRRSLLKTFRPRTVVAEAAQAAGTAVPLIEDRDPPSGAAAYVCENFACELPVSTAKELLALLEPDSK